MDNEEDPELIDLASDDVSTENNSSTTPNSAVAEAGHSRSSIWSHFGEKEVTNKKNEKFVAKCCNHCENWYVRQNKPNSIYDNIDYLQCH